MIKYRVITVNGFCEFPDNEKCLAFHKQYGIGEVQIIDDTPVWDKQTYCDEVNEAHTQLFRNIYLDLGYLGYSEVESWAKTARTDLRSLQWKAEAQSIIDWYQATCITVYDYMDAVTEETAQPIETFINSLPQFNH